MFRQLVRSVLDKAVMDFKSLDPTIRQFFRAIALIAWSLSALGGAGIHIDPCLPESSFVLKAGCFRR